MIVQLPDAYPRQWPLGWERTIAHQRTSSRYSVSPGKAQSTLIRSVRHLGAQGIIMSSNHPVGARGRAVMSGPFTDNDPGVAIHWARAGKQEVMACDRWRHPWENMRAIYHAVEGLRTMERAGASQIMERAFQAFQLPSSNRPKQRWRDFFGCGEIFTPTEEYLKRMARDMRREWHPDNKDTGDEERFKQVDEALREALEDLAA